MNPTRGKGVADVIALLPRREAARAGRRQIEEILDGLGSPWPWNPMLSRILDLWLIVEEPA